MKIPFLRLLKIVLISLIIINTVSCSNESNPVPTVPLGSLTGSVKLYDKFEKESLNYSDVKIELTDSQNTHKLVVLDSGGNFILDKIPYGNLSLVINKAGYGIIETLTYDLQKSADVLSPIKLAEELPLKYDSFAMTYSNGMLHYIRTTNFQPNDDYLVGELICYGKDANVSITNCKFYAGTGANTGVQYINWTLNSSSSFSFSIFTDNGFQLGEKVYAVCYAINSAPFTLYNDQRLNYKITTLKLGNPSPVSSFLLNK
jgi:hypothetical protein